MLSACDKQITNSFSLGKAHCVIHPSYEAVGTRAYHVSVGVLSVADVGLESDDVDDEAEDEG